MKASQGMERRFRTVVANERNPFLGLGFFMQLGLPVFLSCIGRAGVRASLPSLRGFYAVRVPFRGWAQSRNATSIAAAVRKKPIIFFFKEPKVGAINAHII